MNLPKPHSILIFTCVFFFLFSLTLIHPVNRTADQYSNSTYGKLPRHVDRVWRLASSDAAKPFSEVKDHYLFHERNPGLFKFIAELTIRAGAKSPAPLQVILSLLVVLGIVAQFYWLKAFFKHDIFPVVGCLFILGSHFLTTFGSTIHQHPYNFSFFNFCMYFIVKFNLTHKRKYFVYAFLSYLFLCQNYYMFWVSTFVMMVGINWSYGQKILSLKNFALGMAPVITMIILLANIAYAHDGLANGIPKLRKIYKARVLGIVEKGEPQRALNKKDYLKYPLTVSSRVERYFYIPGFLFLLLVWPLRRMRKFNHSDLNYKVFYFIVPAALSWYMFVYEHTAVHQVAGRYSYFLWIIFLAYFSYELNLWCEKTNRTKWKYFLPLILIYGGYGFIGLNMRFFVQNIIRIIG